MSVDFEKAQAIFLDAVELTDSSERNGFLDQACGNDQDLRQHLEILLDAHGQTGLFLEKGALAIGPTIEQPVTEKPGTQIGPYKLLQQIGEGGMGVVYMAEQHEPVKRRVALKIIKPGMDTKEVIARFEAERQALAMMDHPNIAKVLDAGATDSGRPYFVMELVKGIPVCKYCDEQHLPPKERLELFIPICEAIQHAHQKGIIHRDLKPSNVLVALYDAQAVPKVIDFGVAKATSQTLTEKTMFTQLGQIVGTLEYMSPEQAQRNQLDIDTRSDIYSLGVLLYELLTGDTPFDRQRLRTAAFDEMLRIIREEEPPKPSTKISSSEALPSIRTGSLAIPPIPHAHFTRHVSFSPDGTRVLSASADGRFFVWNVASGQLVAELPKLSPPPPHHRSGTCALFDPDGDRVLIGLSTQRKNRAEALVCDPATGDALTPAIKFDYEIHCAAFDPHGGQFAIGLGATKSRTKGRVEIFDSFSGESLRTIVTGSCPIDIQFSPDGRRLVVASGLMASDTGSARVWDVATGKPVTPPMDHHGMVTCVSFHPDGSRVLTAGEDGSARVWDARTGEPLTPQMRTDRRIKSASFSPDGRWVVTGTGTNNASGHATEFARLWDAETGEPVSPQFPHGSNVFPARFSPDGHRFATASKDAHVRIWDISHDERPIEDLTLIAQLLSGSRIDATDTMIPLEPEQFRTAWQELRTRYPQDFMPSFAQDSAWHRQQADLCLADNRWSDAIAHLNHLIDSRSISPATRDRRGGAAREMAEGGNAGVEYSKSIELTAEKPELSHWRGQLYVTRARARRASLNIGPEVLDYFDSGAIAATAAWQHVSDARMAPVGTRLVRVRLLSVRKAGTANDGYYDELSFHDASGRNLLVNSGNEEPLSDGEIPGWEADGTWQQGADLPPRGGSTYFYPGPRPLAELRQDIDVSAYAAAIDTGNQQFTFEGYVRSWEQTCADTSRVTLEYRSAPGSGKPDTISADYSGAIEFGADDSVRRECLAWLALSGDAEKAHLKVVDLLQKIVSRRPEVPGYFRHLAQTQVDFAAFLGGTAHRPEAARQQRLLAVEAFSKAIELDGNDPQLLIERAEVHETLGEWSEAVADYSKAIELKPSRSLYVDRAVAYTNLHSYGQAIADCNEAIRLEPNSTSAYWRRGAAYAAKGELDQAIIDFNEAIRINPAKPWHHLWLAAAHAARGDWTDATAACTEGAKLNPDSSAVPGVHAGLLLLSADTNGYRQICVRMLESFDVTTEPDHAHDVARAFALASNPVADPAETVQLAAQAVAAHPEKGEYLYTLGLAHYRAGEFGLAAQRLVESMNFERGQVNTWLVLAMVRHQQGDEEQARQWLNKARQWSDEHKLAQQSDYAIAPGVYPPISPFGFIKYLILCREAEQLIDSSTDPAAERTRAGSADEPAKP